MRRISGLVVRGMMVAAAFALAAGCDEPEKNRPSATQPITMYQTRPLRKVPEYLHGTIFERADIEDVNPYLVSGYGLVVNLRGTGDNSGLPNAVRSYMVKQMLVHGFGTHRVPGFEGFDPERILRDNRTAVVRVDGFIPPGVRKYDHFDVLVSALDESHTSSLSHGTLYITDLRVRGAEPTRPAGSVNVIASAAGPLVVNPAYALLTRKNIDSTAKASLRSAIVMDGGSSLYDIPLTLVLREPQWSTSRTIEQRIRERFQAVADKDSKLPGELSMAAAKDEGIVYVYIPRSFRGNWEHFAGVVKHLYINGEPGFVALQAQKLADAAVQPDAPLENISYALEGIGQPALPVLYKLMKHDSPDVRFAAARAAACIGDPDDDSRQVLLQIARTPGNPYRVNAVRTLAELPSSAETDQYLRQLVNVDDTLVRIAAYRALIRPELRPGPDGAPMWKTKSDVFTSYVINENFVLDLIPSSGPPMIYATRQGLPRIALLGLRQWLVTPVTFTALDNRLSLTADKPNGAVTIYYRADQAFGDNRTMAIRQSSQPDLADVLARLGGQTPPGELRLDFSYADVLSLLISMEQGGKLAGARLDGSPMKPLLVIEEQTGFGGDVTADAPRIPDVGRPRNEGEKAIEKIPDTAAPPARKN